MRWWPGRRPTHALVLLYHRVAVLPDDPWSLAVSPARFHEQLGAIREWADVVPLATALDVGAAPARPRVAITFDDGYADALHVAAPALEALALPATVFVTTGFLDEDREPWWDDLTRVAQGGAYDRLYARLRPLPHPEQRSALDRLLADAGVGVTARPTHRPLRRDEVVSLAASGLVTIGAHTRTHPVLSRQTEEVQQGEIAGSRTELEDLLGKPVTTFAYPHGGLADYDDTSVRLAEAAGFEMACGAHPGRVTGGTERFRVPRMSVGDWDGDELTRRLRRWWAGRRG